MTQYYMSLKDPMDECPYCNSPNITRKINKDRKYTGVGHCLNCKNAWREIYKEEKK
jgi:transposase-like protein